FDTVWSNTILHHIPDPLPFLKDAHRVLRPGGVLLIRDLFRPESRERVAELVQLYAQNETPYSQELFRASLCAAFTVRELQELKEAAGLTEMKVAVDTDRHMSLQGVKSAESNA
ncbi:MAG: methyltransferase domain-containing protein, partial [Planctomycetes bacterium]|nr:methyltransferase domain-containing protein [Planctomycetota bacterium]